MTPTHLPLRRMSVTGQRAAMRSLVGLVVLIGLFLRIWVLGRQPVNADVAVVGLMAREILHGHFFAFYWGQSYGGGEPYVVAVLFFLFGQSGLVLGLAPVLLDAVATVLVWRIGRRLFDPSVGVGAALVFWVWPEVYVWQSTLEYGFRWATLCCGLAGLLLAARIGDGASAGRRRRLEWTALGLFAGLGWWCSPEIAYYLVPAGAVLVGLVLLRRVRVGLGDLAGAVAGAALGALPWIWSNLHTNFRSLRAGPQPSPGFDQHLDVLRLHALPLALGLQLPGSGHWVFGSTTGRILEYLAVLGGAAFLVLLVARRRALVLVVFLVVFPVAYAYSPFTWYWQDGRYALYLVPVLAILLVAAARELSALLSRSPRAPRRAVALLPGVVVVLALALTLRDARAVGPFRPDRVAGAAAATWTSWQANPTGYLGEVATRLEAAGTRDVIAGYWVAYPLAFESGGALVATDVKYARYAPYLAEVERTTATWLFVRPRARAGAAARVGSALLDPGCAVRGDVCLSPDEFVRYLRDNGVRYRERILGDFVAVIPAKAVDPVTALRRLGVTH